MWYLVSILSIEQSRNESPYDTAERQAASRTTSHDRSCKPWRPAAVVGMNLSFGFSRAVGSARGTSSVGVCGVGWKWWARKKQQQTATTCKLTIQRKHVS